MYGRMPGEGVPVRLLLIDDHELFREGLRSLIGLEPGLTVVGEAADARTAFRLFDTLSWDLTVLDLWLPATDGFAVLREIRRRRLTQPTLVLTAREAADDAAEALIAGAQGFALKRQRFAALAAAMRTVGAGGRYLAPELSEPQVSALLERHTRGDGGPLSVLSEREREVFQLLVRGWANPEIASELCISVKTVETHRTRILKKLEVHSIVDLVRLAARHGLLPQAPPELRVVQGGGGSGLK
jgi:DNA-binding NarL/FixJ family response regulator